ncbi:M16 family metallopeptidase [Nitrospirillum viridazoti]|uniref:Peptidase M16 n=1 Tax=Nitrospirillum viridazoti CBAmc TaxID=1441467 RepID=A0A248JY02_9PROT|nr:pitrilysin family protein [Nitrospirillum amazonense]ASG23074.1 peptidase M16 [Nitrospirillum amazonense CBAmc]TWB38804.1 zinc protease [Nitrospirillum amazonense]
MMRFTRTFTAAATALALTTALCSSLPALAGGMGAADTPIVPGAEVPGGKVSVPPLAITERTLANGLKVIALPDTTTPTVSVQVWYSVGSKDDPKGRSGFAHLFEHMMFKSTRDMAAEQFDRLTEDVGGYNNASTNADYTDYFETVPANHLERILWAEAERMGSLVVDEENFKSERDVVKEELRQRVLAQPYGKLFYLMFPQVSFKVHPYGRPGIGSIEDLDAATLQDVQAFHATYYRPDNATLVVVGNFKPEELNAWVDKYFGPLTHPATPIPRVTAVEPARTAPQTLTVTEANAPLPAVLLSYPFPKATDKDLPALLVLDSILGHGDSSRLNQSLVYEKQVASQVFTFQEVNQQPGAYAIGAILAGGATAEAGEKALLEELDKVSKDGVTEAELAAARNQLVTDELEERETANGRASLLARAAVIFGDPKRADTLLADVQAVTADDVKRVAATWLKPETKISVRYVPADGPEKGTDTVATSTAIDAAPLVVPADLKVVQPAPADQRQAPPTAGPAVDAALPQPVEKRLANGLRVIVAPTHGVPLIQASLRIGGGGAVDPGALPGTAAMTANVLTKGTAKRSAPEIARDVEALGGTLNAAAGWDGSELSLLVKGDVLAPAMEIFADVARNPAFQKEELERERHQALDGLSVTLKDPAGLAKLVGPRVLYADAAYGHPLTGTPKSLAALKPADLSAYHHTWWRPDNATLVLAGPLTAEQGFGIAEKLFGDWAKPATPLPALPSSPAQPAGRAVVVDLPKAGQAAVLVVRPGLARSDKDYYPASVANAVLGVGYSSRLNEEIRIKRGLSYGAGSALDFRRVPGPFVASTQTKNPSAPEVAGLIMTEMGKLGTQAPAETELAGRKAVLIGNFGRTVETTHGVASLVGSLALQGVDLGEIGRYISSVQAVTPAQVQAAAARTLSPAQSSLVVVGDSAQFLPALKQKYPKVQVIPAAQLNLDSGSLKAAASKKEVGKKDAGKADAKAGQP